MRPALGGAIDGLLAEYAVLHEDGLVQIPEHLSFEVLGLAQREEGPLTRLT